MKGCVLLSQLLKTQFYIALPDCTLVLSFCIFTYIRLHEWLLSFMILYELTLTLK